MAVKAKAPRRHWHCTHRVTVERYTAQGWAEIGKHAEAEVRVQDDHRDFGGKLAALMVPKLSSETETWYDCDGAPSFAYTQMYSATLEFWGSEYDGFMVTGYIEVPTYSGEFQRVRWRATRRRRS